MPSKAIVVGLTAIAVGCLGGLVLANASMAAVNPRLQVTSNTQAQVGASSVKISMAELNSSDDAIAELEIYVPTGFSFSPPAENVGTATGSAIESLVDPNTVLEMSGGVAAVSPSDNRISLANDCDSSTHLGVWLVTLSGGGDTFSFPIYVDQTSGSESQFGSYKLVACFLSPYPVTAPAAAEGNKFVSMTLDLSGFTGPTTAGSYLWRSLWMPFTDDAQTLDPAGNVEAQSSQTIGTASLSVTGRLSRPSVGKTGRARVTLTGTLLNDGKPVADVFVNVRHGPSTAKMASLGSAKTNAAGQWAKTVTLTTASYYQVGATIPSSPVTCQASFGVPCLSATGGSLALSSRIVHFSP
jgi:hypothetical protein